MAKTWDIFRHEVISLVSRLSFWVGLLVIPLIGFAVYGAVNLINRSQGVQESSPINEIGKLFTPAEQTLPSGYVDLSGIIRTIPADFNPRQTIRYPDEASAARDMQAGKLSMYAVIAKDYLNSGKIAVFTAERDLMGSSTNTDFLNYLLTYNLLGSETALNTFNNPILDETRINLSPPSKTTNRDSNDLWSLLIPYIVLLLFFFSIIGSASLLLNSMAKEKENRVMEVLMLSATPHQIMFGKIIALGVIGLLQNVIWASSGLALMRLGGQTFQIPAGYQLDFSFLGWGVLFFLLGYLIYASLMAGLGALVPNLREASQATFLITMPAMVPLFLLSALLNAPNGNLAVVLSLFPLTASGTMMLRLSIVDVPLWQIVLSVLLCALTALLIIRAVANMFRAQILLSGQPFRLRRFLLALSGKG